MSVWRWSIAAVGLLLVADARAGESKVEYIQVESKALDKDVDCGVYLPPGYAEGDARYPVVYFLHGMRGTHRQWEQRGCPEILDGLIAEGKIDPVIVVCPNGENGFWINWVNGKAPWEDFLAKDLVEAVDTRYRTRADPGARGIMGDSMGGYGALHIAFKHPDVFGSVSAHSAMIFPLDPSKLPQWVLERADRWASIYGSPVDQEHWKNNHPVHLASTLDADQLRRLRIYFDCGTDDRYGFDAGARELDAVLKERDIPHEGHLRDGNHGRDYFTRYLPYSIQFHSAAFQAKSAKAADRSLKQS